MFPAEHALRTPVQSSFKSFKKLDEVLFMIVHGRGGGFVAATRRQTGDGMGWGVG